MKLHLIFIYVFCCCFCSFLSFSFFVDYFPSIDACAHLFPEQIGIRANQASQTEAEQMFVLQMSDSFFSIFHVFQHQKHLLEFSFQINISLKRVQRCKVEFALSNFRMTYLCVLAFSFFHSVSFVPFH